MKKVISFLCAAATMLGLCSGLTGCGEKKTEKEVVTTPLLRIGILSDVHVSRSVWGEQQHERLEKALRFFKTKGVDGVMITGDLQENTDAATGMTNIEEFTDIWFDVFPDNKNDLTGERVEPLFIYGNHDIGLVDAQYWPERLGTYEDAWIKEIKGYQFVGVHYTKEYTDLAANLAAMAEEKSDGKPFFFAQHQPVVDTVFGAGDGLRGTGVPMFDVLKKYSNCVVFTGHTHNPITDERSIWQNNKKKGAQFTAVNCATTNYAGLDGLTVNGDADATQQGMYMVVDGSNVTLERYSFADMKIDYTQDPPAVNVEAASSLGAHWKFDATQKKDRPYDYALRQEAAAQPVFAQDAVLEVSSVGTTYVNVFIPAATVSAPEGFSDLVQSYYMEAVDPESGEVVSTSEVATEHHVDLSPERLDKEIYMGMDGLQPETTYLLKVYARECYQKVSEPLTVEITTSAEETVIDPDAASSAD